MCPSPYGEVGFNRAKTLREAKIEAASFRPLTGKLVLIMKMTLTNSQGSLQEFPSPYGEVGFNQDPNPTISAKSFMFPSPYGEVGFNRSEQ